MEIEINVLINTGRIIRLKLINRILVTVFLLIIGVVNIFGQKKIEYIAEYKNKDAFLL